jgi:hypothetical protein
MSLSLVVALAPRIRAQTPPATGNPGAPAKVNYAYRYRLLGVYDAVSGEPVEGVEVADVLSGTKALTTKTGTVSLLFLPDGGSLVRLRKLGYEVQTMTVAISPADTAPITVVLVPATQLPTVVVTDSAPSYISPGLRTFEDHRKTGMGQYVTEAEFRKGDNRTMANLLSARFSGLQVVNRRSASYLVSSRVQCSGPALLAKCQSPNCFVTVYVDGVRTFDASMGVQSAPDFAHLGPAEYAAAEFYSGGSTLPDGISPTNSSCGTLLLWTRER